MNTFTKILMTTLPLVFSLLLATVGTTYHFSRTAITELAETYLDARLAEAMKVVAHQDTMLRQYGLETIPASVAKAKLDAGHIIAASGVGKTGYIFAVDADGTIAMHPDGAMVGRDISSEPWFENRLPERRQLVHQTSQGRHLSMMGYFAPWQWYLLASAPQHEVYGAANRIRPYLLGFGVVGFAVIALALMLLTRRLMQPLRMLTEGAERIGNGVLDTRIVIQSRDEFGRLATVFNQMAHQLQETLTALQHREAHFRALIENSSDLIAIVDANGSILNLSPSIDRLLGYAGDALQGLSVFDFVHPDDLEPAQGVFKNRAAGDDLVASTVALRFRHQDGSWRTIEASSKNLLDHPAVGGIVVNARDITKRTAAEAALQQAYIQLEDRVADRTAELFKANARLRLEIEERKQTLREKEALRDQLLHAQKMEAIGTLAGGIAHDFNNLLMGIQGNVDMLALEPELVGHSERLDTIRGCVLSGTGLTKQLLGFARLGKYEAKATNPNELIENSADMFLRTRQELRVVSNLCNAVWHVKVDRAQIEQVLLNLFINAWQAMPEGGTLCLETANVSLDAHQASLHQVSPGNYVRIAVADTGIGMDSATMKRIFDPFFTTKVMQRGTGLGLASAYGIIRNHGGDITVQSAKNKGSTFHIYLKAFDDVSVSARPTVSQKPRTGNETLLLVDDDALIVDVGQAMLSALGYNVIAAHSGEQAVAIYRERFEAIALVILDMIMPDMSGGRTFDALKAVDPGVKVLLASGYSINGQATEIMSRGCNGFIQKPFDLRRLSKKVREIIDVDHPV
jgi:PAS domain S-box-containing protein